jgi:hypothetical protein
VRDGRVAGHLGEQLGGLGLDGGEGEADVAVGGDGLLLAVDALVLGEVLGDQHGATGDRLCDSPRFTGLNQST